MALLLFDIDGTLLAPKGLGRRAFERAAQTLYHRLPETAFGVGDSIHDVRAAKQAGIWSAAVATGNTPAATLEAESPHLRLENLTDSHALWASVRGLG